MKFLSQTDSDDTYPFVSLEEDKEIRALNTDMKTFLGCHYFEKFSS
jgi:hypothetical protein